MNKRTKLSPRRILLTTTAFLITLISIHGEAANQTGGTGSDVPELLQKGWDSIEVIDYEGAIRAFKDAIKVKEDCVEARVGLSVAYNKLGQRKKAITMAREAILTAKDSGSLLRADAYNQLGLALFAPGVATGSEQLKEAEVAFREALRIAGEDMGIVRFNLANVLLVQATTFNDELQADKFHEVCTLLNQYLQSDPKGSTAEQAHVILCGSKKCRPAAMAGLTPDDEKAEDEPQSKDSGEEQAQAEDASDEERIGAEDVKRPVPIRRVKPSYTDLAKQLRIEGAVILRCVIEESGKVSELDVLRGLPYGLNESAVKALKQWEFKPGTLKGRPVEVIFTLTVQFKLKT